MAATEFEEIREAWTELKTIYAEIEALNAEAESIPVFAAFYTQTAAAQ